MINAFSASNEKSFNIVPKKKTDMDLNGLRPSVRRRGVIGGIVRKKRGCGKLRNPIDFDGDPPGIRTRHTRLKGFERCPLNRIYPFGKMELTSMKPFVADSG
jgi:hypothetical protein